LIWCGPSEGARVHYLAHPAGPDALRCAVSYLDGGATP
jgi:hypothetical protein